MLATLEIHELHSECQSGQDSVLSTNIDILPTEVRVNNDLLDGHPELSFVHWTGPRSVNLAGPAAHYHIVRAGVPGETKLRHLAT